MGLLRIAGGGFGMCMYHKERGHYTTQCQLFKRYLEELVAAEHLNQWINTQKNPPPPLVIGNIVGVMI